MTSKRGYNLSALFIALGLAWSVQAQGRNKSKSRHKPVKKSSQSTSNKLLTRTNLLIFLLSRLPIY